MTRKNLFRLTLMLAVLILCGCAAKTAERSGFLDPYPQMVPGPEDGVDMRYLAPGVDFARYNKIMLDHVLFYPTEESALQGLEADKLKELADAFHQAMAEQLQDAYPLVSEPGPDVVRLRVAITDVEFAKPGLNTISTVVPIGLAVSLIKKGVTGEHTAVGSASMEMEALDSLTNKRIAAGVDRHAGGKFSGYTKTGSAKAAFEFWAKRLRTFLDEAHGNQP